jgi:biopolymer transport protein ExbB
MMRIRKFLLLLILLTGPTVFAVDEQAQEAEQSFGQAADSIQRQLEESLAELAQLRQQVVAEKLPLSQKLNDLENELIKVRQEYQQTSRLLDGRTLDLGNLRSEINSRKEEAAYLSNLLSEYIRNFESRLHIAERPV